MQPKKLLNSKQVQNSHSKMNKRLERLLSPAFFVSWSKDDRLKKEACSPLTNHWHSLIRHSRWGCLAWSRLVFVSLLEWLAWIAQTFSHCMEKKHGCRFPSVNVFRVPSHPHILPADHLMTLADVIRLFSLSMRPPHATSSSALFLFCFSFVFVSQSCLFCRVFWVGTNSDIKYTPHFHKLGIFT